MKRSDVSDAELLLLIRGELGTGRANWLRAQIAADADLAERHAALELVHLDPSRAMFEGLLGQAPADSMRRRFDIEATRAPPAPAGAGDDPGAGRPVPPSTSRPIGTPPLAQAGAAGAPGPLGAPGAGVPGAQAFGTPRTPMPDTRAPLGAASRPPRRPWWRRTAPVAFAALCVAAAVGLSGWVGGLPATDWRDVMALSHRRYTALTFSDIAPPPGEAARVAAQLGRLSGLRVEVPDLTGSRFAFKRGQLLRADDRPLVQLDYLSDTGEPLAIAIVRADGGDHPLVFERRHGRNTALWTRRGVSTMVVGDLPDDRLRTIARLSGAKS
ncbi:MAG: hypothetical protein AB7P21_12690 [Lautropia sp.]